MGGFGEIKGKRNAVEHNLKTKHCLMSAKNKYTNKSLKGGKSIDVPFQYSIQHRIGNPSQSNNARKQCKHKRKKINEFISVQKSPMNKEPKNPLEV